MNICLQNVLFPNNCHLHIQICAGIAGLKVRRKPRLMSFLVAAGPSIRAVLKSNLRWKLAAAHVGIGSTRDEGGCNVGGGCKYSQHHHHHHLRYFFSGGSRGPDANVISLRTIIMDIWERSLLSYPRRCNQSLPACRSSDIRRCFCHCHRCHFYCHQHTYYRSDLSLGNSVSGIRHPSDIAHKSETLFISLFLILTNHVNNGIVDIFSDNVSRRKSVRSLFVEGRSVTLSWSIFPAIIVHLPWERRMAGI